MQDLLAALVSEAIRETKEQLRQDFIRAGVKLRD